jgi:DNA replication initiation complex subunit (GINS family)
MIYLLQLGEHVLISDDFALRIAVQQRPSDME